MNYNIEYLRREQWKGYPLPIGYRTEAYYNVVVEETNDGFSMNMKTDCFKYNRFCHIFCYFLIIGYNKYGLFTKQIRPVIAIVSFQSIYQFYPSNLSAVFVFHTLVPLCSAFKMAEIPVITGDLHSYSL